MHERIELPFELWHDAGWKVGLEMYDRGNREPLAKLVAAFLAHRDVVSRVVDPPNAEQCNAIGDIIAGRRTKDGRGRKKSDASESIRNAAMSELRHFREVRDKLKAVPFKDRPAGWSNKHIALEFSKACEASAERYGVDVETVAQWIKPKHGTK